MSEVQMMRRFLVVLMLAMLFVHPASAYAFESASYTQNGIQVIAVIEADIPWESPFTEEINVSITVVPQVENITEVSLNGVIVTVHSFNPGEGYFLLASRQQSLTSPATGSENASASISSSISGSGTGDVCYFGVSVEGTFVNSTGTYSFSTISPENLVGPFAISLSVTSPQFLVGFGFIMLFLVIAILGVCVARRTRSPPKRRRLMEE